jgi:hypothetical protein
MVHCLAPSTPLSPNPAAAPALLEVEVVAEAVAAAAEMRGPAAVSAALNDASTCSGEHSHNVVRHGSMVACMFSRVCSIMPPRIL